MALETGTYIDSLVTTNPPNTDGVSQADDHLRLIKSTVKATFPNITGAVTATHTDLNKLTSSGNPQFSTIELGAASDTTLSRSAAGVVAVEGVTVPLNSITNTHTALQIELGHASDTTLSRSAAGVLAVEGGVVPLENRANTFTASQTINGAPLNLNSNSDYTPQMLLTNAGATGNSAPYYILKRARGTYSSPTIVSSGDQVGTLLYQAHDGTTFQSAASIEAQVDGTPGASDMPGRLAFKTTPDGATAPLERMRIDASGNVGIGTVASLGTYGKLRVGGTGYQALNVGSDDGSGVNMYMAANAASEGRIGTITNHPFDFYTNGLARARVDASGNFLVTGPGGLGYGAGSGGTVTQITSKSTGVTLNKTNGQIITHNANVSATVPVSFVVTNSTVAATDTVIVHRSSGGTNASYVVGCDAVSAGSFRVYISNISGAGLAEALTLNFAVIKAVTS